MALLARPRSTWRPTLIALLAIAAAMPLARSDSTATAPATHDAVAAYAQGGFRTWSALATAATTSPVAAAPGDLTYSWQAPDRRAIRLVVRLPHPRAGAPDITLAAVPPGADARPAFEAALARVRQTGAGRLIIPKARYVFTSLAANHLGHLVLEGLSDVTIEGQGSVFVFTRNETGLFIHASHRVRVADIGIEYSLRMASLATVHRQGGQTRLVIDPAYPVTEADHVDYVSEYDPAARHWVQGGQRAILPPGTPNPAVYAGDQTYVSKSFAQLSEDHTFVVFHQFYGGSAIRIGDSPGPDQPEDVVIDHARIFSGPGMGILVYGVKRGVAILNSRIAPGDGPHDLISTEYDGIHVLENGGDLIIANTSISGQGDDGINLNNPIAQISAIDRDARTLVLAPYSRFISPGDVLAFFDDQDRFVAKATVLATKPLGGLNYRITLSEMPPAIDTTDVVRDVSTIDDRFVIDNNDIAACNCHGILVQIPDGLVRGNRITDTKANAIRLLTSTGTFKEGVGAINVVVRDNIMSHIGSDNALKLPWAAITAYAPIAHGQLSSFPVNQDILITGNRISDAQDGCITISSSIDVKLANNRCDRVNLSGKSDESLFIFTASGLDLSYNIRSGASSGGLAIDADSTDHITTQARY